LAGLAVEDPVLLELALNVVVAVEDHEFLTVGIDLDPVGQVCGVALTLGLTGDEFADAHTHADVTLQLLQQVVELLAFALFVSVALADQNLLLLGEVDYVGVEHGGHDVTDQIVEAVRLLNVVE